MAITIIHVWNDQYETPCHWFVRNCIYLGIFTQKPSDIDVSPQAVRPIPYNPLILTLLSKNENWPSLYVGIVIADALLKPAINQVPW